MAFLFDRSAFRGEDDARAVSAAQGARGLRGARGTSRPQGGLRALEARPAGLAPARARSAAVRFLLICAFAAACIFPLCSCRPTDFFTEVIISPFADQVDEDNPQRTVVNSPDAEQTSDQLSALDWSDDAKQSTEVQSIVTYSSDPTTNLEGYRSLFSLNPRFIGVQSSDAVQLDFTASSTVSEDDPENPSETDLSPQQRSQLEGEAARTQGEQQASEAAGTGDGEADSGTDSGKDGTDGKSGGYDGERKIYDPNNAFADPPQADKIAACGQAAVMVEALGGGGALAAMDASTYNGSGTTAGSFKEVFGDELPSDFESTAILWSNAGTAPGDLADAAALASACGTDGVIVYDQGAGDLESQFSAEDLAVLDQAGITYVPVDFSTVQGMLDAANVIGKILSQSSTASEDASANAEAYWQRVSDVVTSVSNASGGSLAMETTSSETRVLSSYNSCPVSSFRTNHLYTAIGTSYVQGIGYNNGGYQLDTESGILFANGSTASPLSFWAQSAGVWDRAASASKAQLNSSKTATAMIYGIFRGAYYSKDFFLNNTASPQLSRCVDQVLLSTEDAKGSTSGTNQGDGLGSDAFPYLIVSASGSYSASQVKASVVAQMNTYNPLSPYSVLPWNQQSPNIDTSAGTVFSVIGSTTDVSKKNVFFDQGVSIEETVRANPAGLLGSWTGCSMESVLESAWIARIYSGAPANSDYSPLCSYSETELQEAVTGFYRDFYRMDDASARAAYDEVVTDKGL